MALDFSNVEEYLSCFDGCVGINAAYNVPHGAVRLEALGFHDLPLRGYALDKAKDLMRESFEQGAVGFSTGLSYYPHSYSDTQEMVELCKVCAEYDVPLVIHLRTVPRPGVELPGCAGGAGDWQKKRLCGAFLPFSYRCGQCRTGQ